MKKEPIVQKVMTIPDVYQVFSHATAPMEGGKELPVRLFVPENYSEEFAYSLLLILHGAGERGNDNTRQLKFLQAMFDDPTSPIHQAIVVCPQCPEERQWVMTPWDKGNYRMADVPESPELQAVWRYVMGLTETYSVDKDRIYVMGLSMGGFGTWNVAMNHTEYLAAAVPICGGADPAFAEKLATLPIRTFHGDLDETVPIAGTREMAAALQKVGAVDFLYTEYAGCGHNAWDRVFRDRALIDWLFAQRKGKM